MLVETKESYMVSEDAAIKKTDFEQLTLCAIIPTFRREKHLVQTINAILAQTRKPDEILVIDQTPAGEHKPETVQFLKEAHARGDIRLVTISKPSVYPARNKAILLARSDILLYLDDDITPVPDFVERHLSHYSDPDVAGVAGSIMLRLDQAMATPPSDFSKQPYWKQAFTRLNTFSEPYQNMCGMAACNFSIRKDALLKVHGWDEHILNYGDRDLGIRLYEAGFRVDYDPEAKIVHHQAQSGGSRASDKKNTMKPWERCVSLHYLARRHLHGWSYLKYGLFRAARFSFLLRRNFLRPHRWPAEVFGYIKAFLVAGKWAKEGMRSPFRLAQPDSRADSNATDAGTSRLHRKGTSSPKIIVAQLGSRHRYAVPVVFKQAGLLAHFYTDSYAGKGMIKRLGAIASKFHTAPLARALAGRTAALPHADVTAFHRLGIEYWWKLKHASTPGESTAAKLEAADKLAKKVAARAAGFNAVYGFNSASSKLFRHCKTMQAACILDQTMGARRHHEELMKDERNRWKDWETELHDSRIDEFIDRELEEWQLADLILCPSKFVLDSIVSCGADAAKCRIVPYGVQAAKYAAKPAAAASPDGAIHVLFVGSVGLRKGVQYLLEAARLLAAKAEFRVIGPISCDTDKLTQAAPSNARLIGRVPHSEIASHYAWADVFCLPSLFEGSATVTYEALAAGLPVICTENTGSIVRDGHDGCIIPIRNAEAIAAKLDTLANDRDLLARMSENASARAHEFTWEEYGKRLVAAIQELGVRS